MSALTALREALGKATPGPWHVNLRRLVRASDRTVAEVFYADANADLIALIRNHADALLDRLERAEAALREIAEEDQLVRVSGGAWAKQAYERRREIARAALAKEPDHA